MLNPVNIKLMKDDGADRAVIIEPVLINETGELKNTGVYKIYKSDDDESFFTEPLLVNSTSSTLADNDNPDYLGTLTLGADNSWNYDGNLLGRYEQEQVAEHIKNG